jgi:hypothetical protein
MVILEAVVETVVAGERPPWPISVPEAERLVRLSGESSAAEVGDVVQQLVLYNSLPLAGSAPEVIARVIAAENLVLPGGIRARSDSSDLVAVPGCCCGMERWRDWIGLEAEASSPWWGHDPDPWVERIGDTLRLWSDASTAATAFCFEVSVAEYPRMIAAVSVDLASFTQRLQQWARVLTPDTADKLASHFYSLFASTDGLPRSPATESDAW